ncbi:MAG: anti-sigma factor [Acidobacteriota bacterium]
MTAVSEQRVYDLLIDRATVGLGAADGRELDALLERYPEVDAESFELAAAAIDLAYSVPDEPLPAALQQQVRLQAEEYFATPPTAESPVAEVVDLAEQRSAEARPSGETTRWFGWLAAAAVLAVALVSQNMQRSATEADSPFVQAAPKTASERRDALLAQGGELIRLDWTATEDPAAQVASGDVVWSPANQTGFMRFVGLPVNDPSVEQYQLWIFDAEQDDRFPVDGGVFDVAADGEVVVPIVAKLRVVQPTLFAITIEKPGGVVVSSRERLPLLAQVG